MTLPIQLATSPMDTGVPDDVGGVARAVSVTARCISACVGGWSAVAACARTSRLRRINWRTNSCPPITYVADTVNVTTAVTHASLRRQRRGARAVLGRSALDGGSGSEYNEIARRRRPGWFQPGAALFLSPVIVR